MDAGYVQVYTGDGKGKTTAALGLGLRAVGRGLRVVLVQFLKGRDTGELESIKAFGDRFTVLRLATITDFFWTLTEKEQERLKIQVQGEWEELRQYLKKHPCDILILDEVMGMISNGLVAVDQVTQFIDEKDQGMELVLTGRNMPEEIGQRADLVTEMKAVKHYYNAGVQGRIGIEN